MNILVIIIIGLSIPSNCFSQERANKEIVRTVLWEITSTSLKTPSYILGTNHITPHEELEKYPVIYRKLTECKTLVPEVVFDEAENKEQEISRDSHILYFFDLLPKKDYAIVDSFYKQYYGASLYDEEAKNVTALAFLGHVVTAIAYGEYFKNNTTGIDLHLQKVALAQNILLKPLESSVILDRDFSKKKIANETVAGAVSMIKNSDEARKGFNELVEQYKKMEFDYKLKSKAPPYLENFLLTGRNKKWMAQIPSLIEKEPCFIAVGLAHLYYKDGLITQLRKKGYTVKPVDIR